MCDPSRIYDYLDEYEPPKRWVSIKGTQREVKPTMRMAYAPAPEDIKRELVVAINKGTISMAEEDMRRIIIADAIERGLIKQNQAQ